jgi:hypothetical protein
VPAPAVCAVHVCEPLDLALVEGRVESRRWREHYLGRRVPYGANLRYWVRNQDRELSCMLWTSPAGGGISPSNAVLRKLANSRLAATNGCPIPNYVVLG